MVSYDHSLKNHSWEELLNAIGTILERDAQNLESNVNYYKKLIGSGKAEAEQLNRLFERLQIDKHRFTYLSEIYFRLDSQNRKLVLMGLEDVMAKEKMVNEHEPDEWTIMICKEKKSLKTYFLPHSKRKL